MGGDIAKEMTGQTVGRWTVIGRGPKPINDKRAYWLCRCSCGIEKPICGTTLRMGLSQSCGCLKAEEASARKLIDLVGMKFGRLTVIRRSEKRVYSASAQWECLCVCGKTISATCNNLKNGASTSCGCKNLERIWKHGDAVDGADTREYRSWKAAKQRCVNPKHKAFEYYGGRGVKMCASWLDSFEQFLKDMGPCPASHGIDRIDRNGHYEPGNCRWATQREQNQHLAPRGTGKQPITPIIQ